MIAAQIAGINYAMRVDAYRVQFAALVSADDENAEIYPERCMYSCGNVSFH